MIVMVVIATAAIDTENKNSAIRQGLPNISGRITP